MGTCSHTDPPDVFKMAEEWLRARGVPEERWPGMRFRHAENTPGEQAQHQAEVASQRPLPEADQQGAGQQTLEVLEWLEHLPEDADVEPDPLAASDRLQARIELAAGGGRAGAESLFQRSGELGAKRPIRLDLGWAELTIAILTAPAKGAFFHPGPIDQLGLLIPGADQLSQDHGSDPDDDAPGDRPAGPARRPPHGCSQDSCTR